MSERVVITPRNGITAQRIKSFLVSEFQHPGQYDGNPLLNAEIVTLVLLFQFLVKDQLLEPVCEYCGEHHEKLLNEYGGVPVISCPNVWNALIVKGGKG